MSRNKNTAGTGDRGPLPESLVGKIMEADRKAEAAAEKAKKLGEENDALKKRVADLESRPVVQPPAPPKPPATNPEPPKKRSVFDR